MIPLSATKGDSVGFQYQSGFGNQFATEAMAGTLPVGRNSPQKVAHGLYAEQLTGSSFTAPRPENLRTWLYRILPSVAHGPFQSFKLAGWESGPFNEQPPTPEQLRWDPLPESAESSDFLTGVVTYAGNGNPCKRKGCAIHLYAFKKARPNSVFYNADGEMLYVPQQGTLKFFTEMGILTAAPGEIVVIPRGVKFRIEFEGAKEARGYLCENYGQPMRLPGLGPIGANGLANPRDFLSPVAWFEDKKIKTEIIAKFQGHFWKTESDYSPLNVVAWHGNYVPYKYDLARFNTIGTVSFDHPDPSIFTVLTSPCEIPGTANVEFVIFPPRWMVGEDTFRPPYYHRNVMSEFMGCVRGVYDAKPEGFSPGAASLHNCMSGHGPDEQAFTGASEGKLAPKFLGDTLSIMFESSLAFAPTAYAMGAKHRQKNYLDCWSKLPVHFKG
jgi:homogentisate 1,2-dioxygenase